MKTFLILISFLFLTNSNVMHQDTYLKIDKKGNIIGLPKKFSPSEFDLNKKKLRINDIEVIFPKCLNYYFEEYKNPKVNLLASWYHSKEIMPYYLIFKIHDNDVNYGYKILVDLETLELIYVNKFIREGNTTYNPKVELDEKCLTQYKSGIKTIN